MEPARVQHGVYVGPAAAAQISQISATIHGCLVGTLERLPFPPRTTAASLGLCMAWRIPHGASRMSIPSREERLCEEKKSNTANYAVRIFSALYDQLVRLSRCAVLCCAVLCCAAAGVCRRRC